MCLMNVLSVTYVFVSFLSSKTDTNFLTFLAKLTSHRKRFLLYPLCQGGGGKRFLGKKNIFTPPPQGGTSLTPILSSVDICIVLF